MRTNRRLGFIFALLFMVPFVTAQQSPRLRISGNDIQTTEVTAAELAKMPRLSLDLREPHSGEVQRYEGVRLSDLLAKAGAPLGDKLRGRALAMYVLAQASDGYAVAFSIAELDPVMSEKPNHRGRQDKWQTPRCKARTLEDCGSQRQAPC